MVCPKGIFYMETFAFELNILLLWINWCNKIPLSFFGCLSVGNGRMNQEYFLLCLSISKNILFIVTLICQPILHIIQNCRISKVQLTRALFACIFKRSWVTAFGLVAVKTWTMKFVAVAACFGFCWKLTLKFKGIAQ